MPDPAEDLEVAPGIVIPAAELEWQFSRAGGAGGQHVNTSSSRVQLSWDLLASDALDAVRKSRARRGLANRLVDGVVTVVASERRSQLRNRELARERLVSLVAGAIAPPPPPRRGTKPTKGSQQRRVAAKKRRGEIKRMRGRPTDE